MWLPKGSVPSTVRYILAAGWDSFGDFFMPVMGANDFMSCGLASRPRAKWSAQGENESLRAVWWLNITGRSLRKKFNSAIYHGNMFYAVKKRGTCWGGYFYESRTRNYLIDKKSCA